MAAIERYVRRAVLAGLLVAAPLTARGGPFHEHVTDYLRDRACDLADVFRVRLSSPRFGKSLGVHARATCLAQVGVVYFDGQSVGMDRRAVGHWDERRFSYGLSVFTYTDLHRDRAVGNRFTDPEGQWARFVKTGIIRPERVHWDDGRKHPLSFGAELYTGVGPGIDLGIYPLEAFDFAFGLLAIDPWGDDLLTVEKHAWRDAWLLVDDETTTTAEQGTAVAPPSSEAGPTSPSLRPKASPAPKPGPEPKAGKAPVPAQTPKTDDDPTTPSPSVKPTQKPAPKTGKSPAPAPEAGKAPVPAKTPKTGAGSVKRVPLATSTKKPAPEPDSNKESPDTKKK